MPKPPVPAEYRPGPAHGSGRRRWTVIGPLAAAPCVVLLAVALTLVARHGRASGNPAAGQAGSVPASLRSLVGTRWSVVSVRQDGHAAVPVASRLDAAVLFEGGGILDGQDGVNVYQAHYTFASGHMLVGVATVSTAGYSYIGHDAGTLAAINGIGAIFNQNEVAVLHDGDRLQLSANGYTVMLEHPVPEATSFAPELPPKPLSSGLSSSSSSAGPN